MKKVLLVLVMAIAFIGCNSEELRLEQPVNCKQELDKITREYTTLTIEEALSKGWDPSKKIYFNIDNPSAVGYYDITTDLNMAILHKAIDKYYSEYYKKYHTLKLLCSQPVR